MPTPSQRMIELGIAQEGAAVLTRTAVPFALPAEAAPACRVVSRLRTVMSRVAAVHVFAKGLGLAACQVGVDRAAALVHTPDGEEHVLLNPRVVDESQDQDEQFEGCLSFFDVRGLVARPSWITVTHQDIDGQRLTTTFRGGLARLVAHEIDHLDGRLYRDRMAPGVDVVPLSRYRGTGQRWPSGTRGGHER